MLNLPLSGIKKIEAIAQSSTEYISLSQGALRIEGIPAQIKEYMQEILKTDSTDYYQSAWGIMPLRQKLAEKLTNTHNIKFSEKEIIVGHGCMGCLSSIFFTILDPGDDVILPEPTYPAYEKLVNLTRSNAVFVSCKTSENKWKLDIEKIKTATTPKTKIIIFSNPWNPLGITVSRKKINELIEWCEKNKIYLIVDEAYAEYCFDDSFESSAPLVKTSEFVIQVSSFSKNMAMSGWRVGYMVIPSTLNQPIGKVQDALFNCPNVLAQYAALYALDHPELTQKFYNTVKNNIDLLDKLFKPLVKEKIFEYQKPQGSLFLFLKTQFKDTQNLCMSLLKKEKVALIPGKFFGPSGAPFLRLCYAREPEILEKGVKRILNYFG